MPSSLPIQQLLNAAGVAASAASATQTALTFPVDYNDPTAATIPAGVKFVYQSDITSFLTAQATSNFKYVINCWNALPDMVKHDITFNLATGVHRPQSPAAPEAAFKFMDKTFVGLRTITIAGVGPSQYTQIITSQTITGSSTDPYDPWVDVAGTPFTGLNLRGYYVVFDTGQTSLIHKHTDSRLYFIDVPSPTPTTFFVGKPATILRNSYDDVTSVAWTAVMIGCANGELGPNILFNDLSIEEFGSIWDIQVASAGPVFTRVLIDHADQADTFGVDVSGVRAFSVWWYNVIGGFFATQFSVRGGKFASPPQGAQHVCWWGFYKGFVYLLNSYIGGMRPLYIEGDVFVFMGNTVLDEMNGGLWLLGLAQFSNQDQYYTGQRSVVRNSSSAGLLLDGGAYWAIDSAGTMLMFEQCTAPCVVLGPQARIYDAYDPAVLVNGPAGGNTDVGIELRGPQSQAILNLSSNVSGTAGQIKMADGSIWTYTNVKALGPIEDGNGNIMKVI